MFFVFVFIIIKNVQIIDFDKFKILQHKIDFLISKLNNNETLIKNEFINVNYINYINFFLFFFYSKTKNLNF